MRMFVAPHSSCFSPVVKSRPKWFVCLVNESCCSTTSETFSTYVCVHTHCVSSIWKSRKTPVCSDGMTTISKEHSVNIFTSSHYDSELWTSYLNTQQKIKNVKNIYGDKCYSTWNNNVSKHRIRRHCSFFKCTWLSSFSVVKSGTFT